MTVFQQAVEGDRRGLARAMSHIEDRHPDVLRAVGALAVRRLQGPGYPHVLGVTGPPGAGKSTLTNLLVQRARLRGQKVGVVAVDPSSPFSGGAILGDRIRMDQHAADPGVFIRSVASRGHLGGLSRAAGLMVDLMDAAGFDLILVETVGVGQSELSIMEVADTVLVLVTPESGDTVQTMKAGLMEIADVFVVNKADRPGGDRMAKGLSQMVELDPVATGWRVPVVQTSAQKEDGLSALWEAIAAHLSHIQGSGAAAWTRRRGAGRLRTFLDLIAEDARARAEEQLDASTREALLSGHHSPYAAAATWETP